MFKTLLLLAAELLAIVSLWSSGRFLDLSIPVDMAMYVVRAVALAWLAWMVISTLGVFVSTRPRPANPPVRALLHRLLAAAIVAGAATAPAPAFAVVEDAGIVIPPGAFLDHGGGEQASRPADTVTVRPGDNLWRISARHLRSIRSDPQPREVAAHWVEVVERNTPHLRSGDPNLIYPGEMVELPPA